MKHFLRKISFLILIYLLCVNGWNGNRRESSDGMAFPGGFPEDPPQRTQLDPTTTKNSKVKVELNLFGALTMLKQQLRERLPLKKGAKSETSPEPPPNEFSTFNYGIFSLLVEKRKLDPTK